MAPLAIGLLLVWAWALLDVIATDAASCRNLPKVLWVVLVIVFAGLGAVAWLLFGRPVDAGWSLGGQRSRRPAAHAGSGPYHETLAPRYLDNYEVTDRRSQELDEQLDAWERRERELDVSEQALLERERTLDARHHRPRDEM